MWKTVTKWGVLTALLAYVVSMGVWASGNAAAVKCRDVRVIVSDSAEDDTVTGPGVMQELTRCGIPIVGRRADAVDVAGIERFLGRLNNLEDVQCAVASDGSLRIYVEPMRPEIRVFTPSGESYYINKDGKRIDANAGFYANVPVVYGDFKKGFKPVELLLVTRFIQSDPEMSALVSAVKVQDADNILLIPRVRGHVINFGDTTRLEEKRAALLTAYRKILPRKGWMTYDTISVRFRDQIVATRRDKTISNHGADLSEEADLEEATLPDATQQQAPAAQTGRAASEQKPATENTRP